MVKVRIYFAAAFITAVLVMSGFALNWYFNDIRQASILRTITSLETSMSESQLEMLYITEFSSQGCDVLEEGRHSTALSLIDVNKRLKLTEENMLMADWEWNKLKTEQTGLYIKLWMLTLKMQETCSRNITTILYFFDTTSSESRQEGYVLDSITNEYGMEQVLVVPLDYNFDLGIIRILRTEFNVTSAPTVVINEKTKLVGSTSKADIISAAGLL